MGQMIGLLLLVIAAAFGGYVLGSNDAGTATEVRTEVAADSSSTGSADSSGDSGNSESSESSGNFGSGEQGGEDYEDSESYESQSGLPLIFIDELPDEAINTLILIDDDGPFPYGKDGSTFQNREGLLPDESGGYYREYTVDTPGLDHRGAKRIVGGSGGELYYTDTHYESFSEIADW